MYEEDASTDKNRCKGDLLSMALAIAKVPQDTVRTQTWREVRFGSHMGSLAGWWIRPHVWRVHYLIWLDQILPDATLGLSGFSSCSLLDCRFHGASSEESDTETPDKWSCAFGADTLWLDKLERTAWNVFVTEGQSFSSLTSTSESLFFVNCEVQPLGTLKHTRLSSMVLAVTLNTAAQISQFKTFESRVVQLKVVARAQQMMSLRIT
eukprot:scaffold342312_cov49-Prasinocladus_malaysianus.AAC.1